MLLPQGIIVVTVPILEIRERKLRLVMQTVRTNGALFREVTTRNWEDKRIEKICSSYGQTYESRLPDYAQPDPYPRNLSKFCHTSLNEESEIAIDHFKSNLIGKLLNSQLPWNINTKFLDVLPCHQGTSSDPTELTAGKKRQLCTRN